MKPLQPRPSSFDSLLLRGQEQDFAPSTMSSNASSNPPCQGESKPSSPIQLRPTQSSILASQSLYPSDPHLNMAFLFLVEGTLNLDLFHQAWQSVREANQVLQTLLDSGHQPYLAEIAGEQSLSLDFSAFDAPDEALASWASERCQIPCDLQKSLVDSAVINLGATRFAWYLNLHHLVTDAVTTDLLVQQMGEAYCQLLTTGELTQSLKPPYYQDKKAPSPSLEEQAHWQSRQSHPRRTIAFPERTTRAQTTASNRVAIELTKEEAQKFETICTEEGFASFTPSISRFVALSTLLASFLHRISGQSEIGFDATSHGRATPEEQETAGAFIKILPFAADLESGDSFRSLAQRCMTETLSFLQNLNSVSETADASPGNVILNYFDSDFSQFGNFPCEAQWLHSQHTDSIHDLRFQAHHFNASRSLQIFLDFNGETFSPQKRSEAAVNFHKLLQAFLNNPDLEINSVDILSEEGKKKVLNDFNPPSSEPLPERSLIETFVSQAKKTPNDIALQEGDKEITYQDLQERVENLAASLKERGVQAQQPVAVGMKRSLESLVALLAVWRCGAYYIPLPPSLPIERMRLILEDSGVTNFLTRESDAHFFSSLEVEPLIIEKLTPTTSPSELPWPELSSLAYLLYTSGSTGIPKGVPIEHRGAADYIEWAVREYADGAPISCPLFTSLNFDLTVTSLYLPLVTGGTLHIYPEHDGPADSALLDVINENQVDFIKLTPSHLALVRQLDLSKSKIRCIVVGGEDFPTPLARTIHEQFGGRAQIYNEYGPTEAVVGCMIHQYCQEKDTATNVPIGIPAGHSEIYLLNESLQPVPDGVAGELCIARHGLSKGYHERPELTEKHFVPHPFRSGETLYRSGDLARLQPNGLLDCLGRIDRQVKVSGHRIELGEVENSLQAHPEIEQCVVTLRQTRATFHPPTQHCTRCGLPSNLPGASYNAEGVCQTCESFDLIQNEAKAYFKPTSELENILFTSRENNQSEYDCISLLSGGKDSTYMLARLVDLGLRVYAFTLDNGYLSQNAKDNIKRVTKRLNVPHEFATTPAMNAIFRDSLTRFSNVCNGCFKTVYTIAINRALELKIPYIITGLSRGQFFETRLTADLFQAEFVPEDVDQAVLAARKAYHNLEDEVSRTLNIAAFQDPEVFQKVKFLDFYRYCDVSLSEMMSYLKTRVGWIRPSDTGRSTNCLINDVGIYIHKKERGYHSYALPYSWDVRMGHKTREEALDELDDQLDPAQIQTMLDEIGYDENRLDNLLDQKQLVAYYTSPSQLEGDELAEHLTSRLPKSWLPNHFIPLEEIPLTSNGKVDFDALPKPKTDLEDQQSFTAPEGAAEEEIAKIWSEVLSLFQIDATKSFFELGGSSLAAMDVMVRICNHFSVKLPLQSLFNQPTVRQLATLVEETILAELTALDDGEAQSLLNS